MTDELTRDTQKQQSANKEEERKSVEAVPEEIAGNADSNNAPKSENDAQGYFQKYAKLVRCTGWPKFREVITSANFWVASATVAIAIFTWLTYTVVSGSSQDTQKLISAAQTQAQAAQIMANAADQIRKTAKDLVAQDQRIADNAKASLDASTRQSNAALIASNRQSRASLEAAIEGSHSDQRAWLTISRFMLSEEPKLNVGVTVTLFIAHTGRTPALELVNGSNLFLRNIDPPEISPDLPFNPPSRSIVAPGIGGLQFTTNPLILKTPQEVSFYASGLYKLYVEALVRYRDTFGQAHWTRLCAYHTYGAPLDKFEYCEQGNEVDGEEKKAN